ncbi:hypothetical protein [Actinoplanes couchii]|uniref:Uncharacterized protein n=1 Tax=Actinoplanes couchii TaxID=403638 RepID=A0ABQ3XMX1_9ACTN|nr:hypothetical protein [Actinoplanes couchii]MDR6317865.1 hypothetical protein [Actinoplanes couchii]GID59852.1 hypothetical protein Aco03nite_082560 [Actinoplanes couchii]
MFLAIALLVPAGVLAFNRWWSDLEVTFPGQIDVREDSATSVKPEIAAGWDGGTLVFTPALTPVTALIDCVIPAVLRIVPRMDGRPGEVIAARSPMPAAVGRHGRRPCRNLRLREGGGGRSGRVPLG